MLWYLIELYGVGTKPPSAFKLGRMETGKLLANLGMAKFFQALRSRSADARKQLEDAQTNAQKAVAENADLQANLTQLKKQLEEMARRERAGGAGNGGGK
jgi:regulator of replication initiation timing